MSGIMLYIPGGTGATAADLSRLGAGDLLDPSVSILPFPCERGPDGKSGQLIIFDRADIHTPHRFHAESQTWIPAAKSGDLEARRYWVGFDTAKRPGPAELQRVDLFDGMPVLLADGKQWIIPVADYLPQRLTRDTDTGAEVRVPSPQHEDFVREANRIYEHMMSSGFAAVLEKDLTAQIPGGLTFAGKSLAKNYRVNADVVDVLGLVNDQEALEIAMVAVGIKPFLDMAQKKSAVGGESYNPQPNSN